jgi:hypothetical protein
LGLWVGRVRQSPRSRAIGATLKRSTNLACLNVCFVAGNSIRRVSAWPGSCLSSRWSYRWLRLFTDPITARFAVGREIETWSVGAYLLRLASTAQAAAGETSRAMRLALLISATRRS